MQRFILEKTVLVSGKDFLGREAVVRLEPVDTNGWFWNVDGVDVPIDATLLESKKNRVMLAYKDERLHVFEHLGALRFSGLDGVRITSGTPWLPYDGSSQIFWKECLPRMRPEGTLKPFCVPEEIMEVEQFFERERSIFYSPGPSDSLRVEVFVDYPDVGHHRQTWKFPRDKFGQIARVKTQGWPQSRRSMARVASKFGWPHLDSIVWPQEHDAAITTRLFARHRALDILGTFSVLCPPGGILTGTIRSHCAGHVHDIALVKQANVFLTEKVEYLSAAIA